MRGAGCGAGDGHKKKRDSHNYLIFISTMMLYHDHYGQRNQRAPGSKRDINPHAEKEPGRDETKVPWGARAAEPVIIRSFLSTTLQQILLCACIQLLQA